MSKRKRTNYLAIEKGDDNRYHCELCPKSYQSLNDLYDHLENYHGIDERYQLFRKPNLTLKDCVV